MRHIKSYVSLGKILPLVALLPLFDFGADNRQRLVAKLLPQLAEGSAVREPVHSRLPSCIMATRPLEVS